MARVVPKDINNDNNDCDWLHWSDLQAMEGGGILGENCKTTKFSDSPFPRPENTKKCIWWTFSFWALVIIVVDYVVRARPKRAKKGKKQFTKRLQSGDPTPHLRSAWPKDMHLLFWPLPFMLIMFKNQVKDPEETIHIISGLKTYTQYLVSCIYNQDFI